MRPVAGPTELASANFLRDGQVARLLCLRPRKSVVKELAGRLGFEPRISASRAQRDRQLRYRPILAAGDGVAPSCSGSKGHCLSARPTG